jgi:hypothetical protein
LNLSLAGSRHEILLDAVALCPGRLTVSIPFKKAKKLRSGDLNIDFRHPREGGFCYRKKPTAK